MEGTNIYYGFGMLGLTMMGLMTIKYIYDSNREITKRIKNLEAIENDVKERAIENSRLLGSVINNQEHYGVKIKKGERS